MPAVAKRRIRRDRVRIDELPITPDKVLAALEKKAKANAANRAGELSGCSVPRADARAAALGRRRRQIHQRAAAHACEEGGVA